MNIRTDLALESFETLTSTTQKQEIEGLSITHTTRESTNITTIEITSENASNELGRPCGKYITIEVPPFGESIDYSDSRISIIADNLRDVLPCDDNIFVVGLGNDDITPDALGPLVASKIFATRHISNQMAQEYGLTGIRCVSAVIPGVLGKTGVETAETVAAISKKIQARVVIVVDALAAKNLDRLGKTIQISTVGISPGSGVQNARSEISESTVGAPVISLGIPTVIDAATLVHDFCETTNTEKIPQKAYSMMVTPRDIDALIKRAAEIVSLAINVALQPSLSAKEIAYLTF